MTKSAIQFSREELANTVTHGLSALLAAVGLVALIIGGIATRDPWRIATLSAYGVCLTTLFVISTCYHACKTDRAKHRLRVLDHSAIFLLIAGTYTPFVLISMDRGGWGWGLFITLWTLAGIGIVLKTFFVHRFSLASTIIYILMGWAGLVAFKPLLLHLSGPCLAWVIAGGVVYTLGVIFYVWKKLPYNHAIWHLFVTGGSVCHFIAIARYVMPMTT